LKKQIERLTSGKSDYWSRVIRLAGDIEAEQSSIESDRFRIKLVDPSEEQAALSSDRSKARNWSKYLRAPLSYYEIFEGGA
jgi:hypothetical protein